jgi:hypothetical protein
MQLRYLVYPGFIISCLLVFWNTRGYGFATDYLGWLYRYRDGNWGDVFTSFGYPGLHQVFHLVNYTIFKVFGTNIEAIGTLFIVAHGSLGYFINRVFRRLLEKVDEEKAGLIAFFTGVVFTLSPFCVEVVSWDACFHYMLCTSMTFYALYCLARYLEEGRNVWVFMHFLSFSLSLFTIELSLVSPALFMIYGGLYTYAAGGMTSVKSLLFKSIPIYLTLLVGYFLLTKISIGSWVGHYGAAKHLNLDPSLLISTFAKYISKIGLLVHFWKFNVKEFWYGSLDKVWIAITFIGITKIALLAFYFRNRNKLQTIIPFVGFVAFFIAILPVLNLFFLSVIPFENDRYTYYAAPHFYLMIISLIIYLSKGFHWGILIGYIVILGIFLSQMISTSRQAGNVTNGLVKNFDHYDAEELVFLCIPENLNGAYLFRDYSSRAITINETLDWLKNGKVYKGKTYNIAQYNMLTDRDSVKVSVLNSTKLRVDIASWGTWFWKNGKGLSSYEDENFKVTMGDLYFILEDKKPNPKRRFLYTVADQWRSVSL